MTGIAEEHAKLKRVKLMNASLKDSSGSIDNPRSMPFNAVAMRPAEKMSHARPVNRINSQMNSFFVIAPISRIHVPKYSVFAWSIV